MIRTDNYIYLHINVIDTCPMELSFLKPLQDVFAADLLIIYP